MSKTILERFHSFVESEYTACDVESLFDDCLNEIYSFDKVGGPFEHMEPSRVLKEIDPVAYRCGVNDHSDSLSGDGNYVEINDSLYCRNDVESAKDEFIDELRENDADESEIEAAEAIDF